MNILTAATLDFADHLRKVTKGWRIDPLVQAKDCQNIHNDYVAFLRPPPGQSHTHFFAQSQPPTAEFTTLLIKVPGETYLRMIQCKLIIESTKPKLLLLYFRVQGFRQNERSTGYKRGKHPDFDYNDYVVYRTWKIERITKGTKNRGKRRKGKPSIIHRDRIDISVPESAMKYAIIARATLEKSFDKHLRVGHHSTARMAVVIDGDNFTYNDRFVVLARLEYG